MLNQIKTHASIETLRKAFHLLGWLEVASDSAHKCEIGELAERAKNLLHDLEMLAERAGFHPET